MSLDGSDAAVVGFSTGDARRIAEAVRRDERRFRNTQGVQHRRRRWPVAAASALIPCRITSGVTAGSEASPTPFNATVLVASGTGAGLTTTGGQAVTAYNRAAGIAFSASTSSPKSGWLTRFNGNYYLVSADC